MGPEGREEGRWFVVRLRRQQPSFSLKGATPLDDTVLSPFYHRFREIWKSKKDPRPVHILIIAC
jgi:hypothetical protein